MHKLKSLLTASVLALALLGTSAPAREIVIRTEPLLLNDNDPAQTQLGSLTYLGGLVLDSDEWRFGGISGLAVSPDGGQLLALTDRASWLAFRPVLKDGKLAGVTDSEVRYVRNEGGGKWGEGDQDSEAVALSPDGHALVAFERNHRIVQFNQPDPDDPSSIMMQNAAPGPDIPELGTAPHNAGLESLVFLDAERILGMTEGARQNDNDDAVRGWIIDENGPYPVSYETRDGYVPTDMALLPDGDVIAVERYFNLLTGVRARICIIERESIAPGATLICNQIAELRRPISVDNMEGIAAYQNARGETTIYLASDDNFSSWRQRTLLMMFRLEDGASGD